MSLKAETAARVNDQVNARWTYVADPPDDDHWPTVREAYGLTKGDCEDAAAAKLAELVRHGFSDDEIAFGMGFLSDANGVGLGGHQVALFLEDLADPWVLDWGPMKKYSARPDLLLLQAAGRLTDQWEVKRV